MSTTCTHHNNQQRAACPVCLVTALTAERDQLRAEVERLKTCGITELAAVNPSVLDYCKHWEARAERAEAELAAERARTKQIATALTDAISTYFGADKLVTAERIEAWQAALKEDAT